MPDAIERRFENTFEQVEHIYYTEHFVDHVDAQNARKEKNRHTERNRTVEDFLKNKKTCPEESIYQIGTVGESVSSETLFKVVSEFYEEFDRQFGSCVHTKGAQDENYYTEIWLPVKKK